MQLELLTLDNFFKKSNPAQIKLFEHSEKLLQAFFSQKPEPPFEKKITLTDQYLVISQKNCDDYEPVLFLELSQDILFHKLQHLNESKSKTPNIHGLSLIISHQKTVHLYFHLSSLLQLWITRLANVLNKVGFHDEYRIIDRIGKGSTSTVFKVQRITDGKIFAAKVFLKSFLQSKTQRKSSAFNQISLLRGMEHQNIMKIYEVYQSSSAIYIIAQHLDGGTLFERINQVKGLRLPQIKKVMKGIVQGLNYMHRFGIMHRDIKLQNIMLKSKGSLEVVILDFGLAAVTQDEPYIFYRCGTPGYIAPQIISMQSNEKINVICDIFSAGVILHILLTNKYLFLGENNQQVYKNNKNGNFDLSDKIYSGYDRGGMALLSQMLQMDCEERISAEDILQHQFLEGLSSEETPKEEGMFSPAITASGEDLCLL